jgi:hypothetical protein
MEKRNRVLPKHSDKLTTGEFEVYRYDLPKDGLARQGVVEMLDALYPDIECKNLARNPFWATIYLCVPSPVLDNRKLPLGFALARGSDFRVCSLVEPAEASLSTLIADVLEWAILRPESEAPQAPVAEYRSIAHVLDAIQARREARRAWLEAEKARIARQRAVLDEREAEVRDILTSRGGGGSKRRSRRSRKSHTTRSRKSRKSRRTRSRRASRNVHRPRR